jgi:hypothetical protein
MSEPKARAAKSGKQSELHVTAHSSLRSGEAFIGARRLAMSQVSPHELMEHQ